MRVVRTAALFLVALLSAGSASAQSAAAPCAASEHRQFDFWLGEWEVRGPAGRLAGINRISSEYGGCVIHERYDTERGYKGESLNKFDAGRKVWHQTWVDSAGLLLLLEGGLRGSQMVLEGESIEPGGKRTRHRITWTPNDDGSVRQFWESTDDKGAWSVAFDGRYTRRKATP
jgi:hypothetical protein